MLLKKTRYSLNTLIFLAKKYNKGPVRIKEIAESENIPKKFLEAILIELKNAGFVSSKKGKGGGYYLIKKPKDINLADVIRQFDGAIALTPCVSFNYYEKCEYNKNEKNCGLRNIFEEAHDETVKILKKNSLADVIRRENLLKKKNLKKT
jgi:Rrf2 family protein